MRRAAVRASQTLAGSVPPGAMNEPAGPGTDLATAGPRGVARARWGRVTRVIGLGAVAGVALVTTASLLFNAATRPPETRDPGFGEYVRVGATDLHYQRWGATGTPIVLVPGFLEASVAWGPVAAILGARHRVFALDLPGHGYTRYSGPMTLAAQAGLVADFVRELDLDRPLLVGHSLGAVIVASVALAVPDTVGAVVFADGDGLPIDLGPRWVRAAVVASPYATSALRIGARWEWAARRAIEASCGAPCTGATPDLAREWIRPLGQAGDARALLEMMREADYGLRPDQIAAISVPTAILWGAQDEQGGSLDATLANLHQPPVHVTPAPGT